MMRKQICILILVTAFLSVIPAKSQEGSLQRSRSGSIISNDPTNVPQELRDRIGSFFGEIEKSNLNDAFTTFLKNSPIGDNSDDIKNLVSLSKKSFETYGSMKGYEFVNAEFITNSFFRARYISLNSIFPLRWSFTFYRSPKKGWIVSNLKFDDLSEYFFSDQ